MELRGPELARALGDGEEESRSVGCELGPMRSKLLAELDEQLRSAASERDRPEARSSVAVEALEENSFAVGTPFRVSEPQLVHRIDAEHLASRTAGGRRHPNAIRANVHDVRSIRRPSSRAAFRRYDVRRVPGSIRSP